jgi:hypothetical protein
MGMIPLEPYKNREHVIAEIRRCASMARVSTISAFLFIALGVISDALDTVLILHPIIWLLLAISMGIMSIVTHMHVVAAKHFLGIESESKKE